MNDRPYFRGNEIELTGCGFEALENSARYFVQSIQTKNSQVAPLPEPNKIKHTIKRYSLVRVAKLLTIKRYSLVRVAKLLTVAALLFSTACFAKPPVQRDSELCLAYTRMGRAIMQGRQAGMPIEEVLALTKSKEGRDMVIIAYGRTRYLSEEYQKRAVDDFAAEVYVECMR